MTSDISEFSFLPGQATRLGVDLPVAERLSFTLHDGRTLSALRFGNEQPRVALIHGAGLNAHTWDTTALLIGEPLLAIDLAGHGDSSWREDARYMPAQLAEDIAEALSAWATQPLVIVGQSLGGLTAAALAASHPELVRSVIVVDITPGVDSTARPSELRRFFAGPTDFASRDELVDKAMAFGLGGSRPDTERGVFFNTRVRNDGRVEWKHHFAHIAAAVVGDEDTPPQASVLDGSGWSHLQALSVPVTLVRGTRGYVTDENLAEFRTTLPSASVVELDATHNVQESAPRPLAELIRSAL